MKFKALTNKNQATFEASAFEKLTLKESIDKLIITLGSIKSDDPRFYEKYVSIALCEQILKNPQLNRDMRFIDDSNIRFSIAETCFIIHYTATLDSTSTKYFQLELLKRSKI